MEELQPKYGLLEKFYGDGSSITPEGVEALNDEIMHDNIREKIRPILAAPGASDGYYIGTRPYPLQQRPC